MAEAVDDHDHDHEHDHKAMVVAGSLRIDRRQNEELAQALDLAEQMIAFARSPPAAASSPDGTASPQALTAAPERRARWDRHWLHDLSAHSAHIRRLGHGRHHCARKAALRQPRARSRPIGIDLFCDRSIP
jgi:hypothetical protein